MMRDQISGLNIKVKKIYQSGKYFGRNKTFEEVIDNEGKPKFLIYNPDEVNSILYQKDGDFRHLYSALSSLPPIRDDEGNWTEIHPREVDMIIWKLPKYDEDFTKPQSKLSKLQIFEELKQFIYDNLDLPDTRLYDIITIWVMATWISEKFKAVPYLNILAPINTGKSKFLEVLEAVCYRGFKVSAISESSIFRSIDRDNPTLLIDEAQIYDAEDKKSVIAILNEGYRIGGKVIRQVPTKEGDFESKAFKVFGFKAIAGIAEPSESIVSRCIQIQLFKAKRQLKRFINYRKADALREQLLYYRLETLNKIDGLDELDGISEDAIPSEWENTNGRFLEKYMVLYDVAKDQPEVLQNILTYGQESFNEEINQETNSIEAELLNIIIQLENCLSKQKVFSVEVVTQNYNTYRAKNDTLKENDIGRIIKRIGFKPRRTNTGHRGYEWNSTTISKLCDRYRIKWVSSIDSPSNPSNPSIIDYTKKEASQ